MTSKTSKLSFTGRIASFSFRHKWYVLGAWVLMLVAAGALSSGLSKVLTTDQKDLSNSDAAQALRLINDRYGERPLTEIVVTRSDAQTVDDPQFQALVGGLADRLRATNGVAQVTSYVDSGDASMVSADRHAALTSITMAGDIKTVDKNIQGVIDDVKGAARPDGFTLNLTGNASANHELNKLQEKDITSAESIGIPVALIVMVLAFGTVLAAGIPLLLSVAAIGTAIGSVAVIGHAFELNFLVTNIITMIGLAVGIDYSLFIIGRYREEMKHGHSMYDAMGIAADSSGRAVFFSGITVLLALAGMLFVRNNIFVSIGVGAMVVVLYAVLASLTLLPAVLGILGRRINWLRVPFLGKAGYGGRFWGMITNMVQAKPVYFLVGSVALLLAAAFPLTGISLGSNGFDSLPHSTDAYKGITALQRDFKGGLATPMQVVIDGSPSSPAVQQAVARLQAEVAQRPNLQWLGVTPDAANRTALVEIATSEIGTGNDATVLIRDMQDNVLPEAFRGTGVTAHLGGELAGFQAVRDQTDSALPIVFAFVLGLSFLLLLLVFRSVIIPAKAIIMNLLSVGAAYGLLVAVFQHGFLAKELGFKQTSQIEFWLPLFLFSILFGLSMDYHVFLLSRIKEEFHRTGDNKEAVATGVHSTAGMITSAAIIMVAVFAGFARGSMVSMQQMGFGLAIAVFMDATIIRSVLVPASMQLLGKYNWWMPSWLNWLPRIDVEGAGALQADGITAAAPSLTAAGAAGD